jgi:steroid delta-isomerase-like uncharacterized protein
MATAVDVHRAAHDAFNRRDWEKIRAMAAPDLVYDDHPRNLTIQGPDDFIGWLQGWVTGMSDARPDEPRYLDAGTHSIAMFRGRGVNDGPMGPANATGKSIDVPFCEIVRVEDGRIAGGDIYYDAMTMFAQLGVVEAPAAA